MGGDTPTPDNPSLAAELVEWAQSKAAATQERNTAAAADKLVTTSGTDPDYMPGSVIEAFMSMPHQQILDVVKDMQPGVMHTTAQAWNKTADAVMFNTTGLNAKVQKTLSSGWEGATAEAISRATRRFTDQMTDMHNTTQSVASRIESAAYGAETVKGAVPSIPSAPGKPAVPGAENPAAVIGQLTAASEAEQEARRAMVAYYVPTYQPAGQQVPVYVPPAGPEGPSSPTALGITKPGSVTSPSSPIPTSPGSKPGDSTGKQQNEGNRQDHPVDTDPSAFGNSVQQNNSGATTPASMEPNSTTPASVNSGDGTLGTVPGWSAAGTSTGGGALGNNSDAPGGPGRSIPGTPSTNNTVGGAAAASRAAAAAAGTSRMPGMGMPGGKGKKEDEDKERKGRPELLVHERNKADLVGESAPTTPAVFGQKSPATEDNRMRRDQSPAGEDDRRQ